MGTRSTANLVTILKLNGVLFLLVGFPRLSQQQTGMTKDWNDSSNPNNVKCVTKATGLWNQTGIHNESKLELAKAEALFIWTLTKSITTVGKSVGRVVMKVAVVYVGKFGKGLGKFLTDHLAKQRQLYQQRIKGGKFKMSEEMKQAIHKRLNQMSKRMRKTTKTVIKKAEKMAKMDVTSESMAATMSNVADYLLVACALYTVLVCVPQLAP